MEDKVIQIEVVLNFVNTLLTKALYFKDNKLANDLNIIRRGVYYDDNFDYRHLISKLNVYNEELKKYE